MDDSKLSALFTFGVIADVQYADVDDGFNFHRTRQRYYRSSLLLLRSALERWSKSEPRPDFILQLGDIIDGVNKSHDTSKQALDTVLKEFKSNPFDVHHVLGNHDFYNFSRSQLLPSWLNSSLNTKMEVTGAKAGGDIYAYHFSPFPGYRFVVLDAYDVSLLGREESSKEYRHALSIIRQHNPNEDLNCPPACEDLRQRFAMFNGGFSQDQLDWLDSVLSSADEKQERVTLLSHLPIHPDSTEPTSLSWNYEDLLAIIRSHSSVVLFIAGHDHDGGFYKDEETGVHHLTLPGVIETPPDNNAFGIVSMYKDRMVLKGNGRIRDQVFVFPVCQNAGDIKINQHMM